MQKLFLKLQILTHNKTFKVVCFSGLIILCIIPAILAVLFAPIVPDTAYYLSVVERINDGIIPYRDMASGYTPLVFYLTLILKKIFSIGINYEFYLTVHFILQFICAYIVYLISNLLINRKTDSLLAAILFILASHWNDGNYFLLETPAIFFGLLALLLALKYPTKTYIFLIIGFLSGLSFLSKQYGLGFLGLSAYLSIFNKNKWKQLGLLFLGFIIPIAICFLIWGGSFYSNIFNNYGEKRTVLMGLYAIVGKATYLFVRFPILIASLYFIPAVWKNLDSSNRRNLGLLVFGILGFLLQFYFAKYAHYFLFIIPFAALLAVQLIVLAKQNKRVVMSFVLLSLLLSVYATYHDQVYNVYFLQKNKKAEQYALAKEILSTVDTKKSLYIADIGLISQYYLTNMTPPNLKSIGYTFAIALTEKTHLQQINSATYVLKFKTEYNHYNLNTTKVQETLKARHKRMLNKDVVLFE